MQERERQNIAQKNCLGNELWNRIRRAETHTTVCAAPAAHMHSPETKQNEKSAEQIQIYGVRVNYL